MTQADPSTDGAELQAEVERLRLLWEIGQEFNSSLDTAALLPQVFHRVVEALSASAGSLWVTEGDQLRCVLAEGGAGPRMIGATMPVGAGFVGDVASRGKSTVVTHAVQDPRFAAGVAATGEQQAVESVMAAPMVAGGETVGAIQVADKDGGRGMFTPDDRLLLEGLAASAAIALRNARLLEAEKRVGGLATLLEISREISSTLDLDRVLRTVVNAASRALTFDRGAVGVFDGGRFELRALAGEGEINTDDPIIRDLGTRIEWAAGRGEAFYLTDRDDPVTDAERTFLVIFGDDLVGGEVGSGLYLPLADEEGTLGVLAFEATRTDFATPAQQELAGILATQTAVAIRNAQLYHQVPLAETLGGLAARRRALLALPKRRLQVIGAAAAVLLVLVTLVRWPFRVAGESPQFRPAHLAEVRTFAPGVVEEVLVREGDAVARGAPLAVLRNPDLRAGREEATAEALVAEREAARARSGGDAASAQLELVRSAAYRREAELLTAQVEALVIRAPVDGVVLTARPEERVGRQLAEGGELLVMGRVDTLELEFAVTQKDIARVRPGQEIRLRVDALPQRTFKGRVTTIGEVPDAEGFPVRAAVPNPDALLRPGMNAYARVLTDNASVLGRAFRAPARWLRLFWWRVTP
ncbi:MAG: GAF domain-containing protein [Gemmatimonadales bacterium]